MEQNKLQKTKKSIPQVVFSIWSYLFFYFIAFGIFFSILSFLLINFLGKNLGEILSYLFLALIWIWSVKMVVRVVTKKIIILREDIAKISIGTAAVSIVVHAAAIIFNIFRNQTNLTNLYQWIILDVLLDIILFLSTYYWLKKTVSQNSA